ncbi:MAG: RDD family protein [Haliea sp.]|uniref:RDD family protein n=1 Tax=Haliea sp. TaxID=1932666 RepID=UPI0032EC3AEB
MPDTPELPPPSLLRRLAAMVYDTLLVIPFIGVTIAAATALEMWLQGAGSTEYHQMHPQLVQALSLACVTVFFTAFWRKGGQTLGMQAWRVKLVDSNGDIPGVGRCVLRCLAALVSLAPAGLGYWWCLVDKRGRYWHDHLSGTHLLLLPKPPGKQADAS